MQTGPLGSGCSSVSEVAPELCGSSELRGALGPHAEGQALSTRWLTYHSPQPVRSVARSSCCGVTGGDRGTGWWRDLLKATQQGSDRAGLGTQEVWLQGPFSCHVVVLLFTLALCGPPTPLLLLPPASMFSSVKWGRDSTSLAGPLWGLSKTVCEAAFSSCLLLRMCLIKWR